MCLFEMSAPHAYSFEGLHSDVLALVPALVPVPVEREPVLVLLALVLEHGHGQWLELERGGYS